MDGKRRSAMEWLRIAGFAAACVLTTGAGATTSTLDATGFAYSLQGNTATLSVDGVQNLTDPPRISGELFLELWAFPVPYVNLSQSGYQQIGYKLASYSLGRLAPGYVFRFMNSGAMPFTPPPAGTWYITSFVTEYDASAINSGGYLPRAFFDYAAPLSPLSFADAPPPVSPEAGLWWDTAQVGTGYSINVKHGVLVVTVYTYNEDGTATWYIASGPLTNNGQAFTGTLNRYTGGPGLLCGDVRPPAPAGTGGSITINFASPTAGTVYLPGGRVAHIVPASF